MRSILRLCVATAFVASAFATSFFSTSVFAASPLNELQSDWAIANYQLKGKEQEKAFETLIIKADNLVADNEKDPELLIWQGIIKSTYAGIDGGLGALGLVKAAKASLEKAMEIDEMAMGGSAYTSLGALYYQVPGWPIAFGNDKKARQLLEKAVALNPDGMDANYFYADFLVKEKEYAKAKSALERALAAAPRPGREVADEGRKADIHNLMNKIPK